MATKKEFRFSEALKKENRILSNYGFACALGVLLLIWGNILMGTMGCSLLVNGPPVEETELKNNAYSARIRACRPVKDNPDECRTGRRAITFEKVFSVCMTDGSDGDNPNQNDDMTEPTFDDLIDDCNERLIPITKKMLQECEGNELADFIYICEIEPVTSLTAACEEECNVVLLDEECSNLEEATAVIGPVELLACLAEPDDNGLGDALSGRSIGEAFEGSGSRVVITRGNDDPQEQSAEGILEFDGDLSENVTTSYRVDNVDTFTFGGLFGLPIGEVTLEDVIATGASTTSEAVVGGLAVYGPGTFESTGGGKLQIPLASDKTGSFVATNSEDVEVTINTFNKKFELETVTFGDDDGTLVEIFTLLRGNIINQPPEANAGDDVSAECTSPDGAEVMLDGSNSTDPDNNIVAYQWRRDSRTGEEIGELQAEATEITTNQTLGTSADYVLNVLDAFMQIDSDSKTVLVVDTTAPVPVLAALPDLKGECSASITSTPTAIDLCVGNVIASTEDPLSYVEQGSFTVNWTYDDGNGNTSNQMQNVTVKDTMAPTIDGITANPNTLSPPNHKMREVNISAVSSDNCDPNPKCVIASVSSNEPVNGTGDGNTAPDWETTGDLTLNLRAERSGSGSSRIYTIGIECSDAVGNSTADSIAVTVPKN